MVHVTPGSTSLELFLSQIEKEQLEVLKFNLGCLNFSKDEYQLMCSLANDRRIAIKKAENSFCFVIWDQQDFIAEASKQLYDGSVYKSAKFKGFKRKSKITEKEVKILQLNIKEVPIWK